MIELKILEKYFTPLIEGHKPFEIRKTTDRTFKPGDIVKLNEFLGREVISACECIDDCEFRDEIDIDKYGDEEAIAVCRENRTHCSAYLKFNYSGRSCTVKIKEVFDLTIGGLENYVAWTFDILETNVGTPYVTTEVLND